MSGQRGYLRSLRTFILNGVSNFDLVLRKSVTVVNWVTVADEITPVVQVAGVSVLVPIT
jgi:hypothetical protein